MRLSEAIRLGSMTTKPARGIETDGKRACARGAALMAAGIYDSNGNPNMEKVEENWGAGIDRNGGGAVMFRYTLRADAWPEGWREVLTQRPACPVVSCQQEPRDVWVMLAHLNDHHRWSRTRVADWVETIEDRLAADAADKAEEASYAEVTRETV